MVSYWCRAIVSSWMAARTFPLTMARSSLRCSRCAPSQRKERTGAHSCAFLQDVTGIAKDWMELSKGNPNFNLVALCEAPAAD